MSDPILFSARRQPAERAQAAIFGCAGPQVTAEEAQFFAQAQPYGFILFARNVQTPDQLRGLTAELRQSVGWDAPIFIDQEGGRVARLRAPHWREWAPVRNWTARADAGEISEEALQEALTLRYRVIASELRAVGIDANCAPVLDVPVEGAHDVIGDRAYGCGPDQIAARAQAVCKGLLQGGVATVIKHIPGHGRAMCDTHEELAVVGASSHDLAACDWPPFYALREQAMAMTAHVVYSAIDDTACATLSKKVIQGVIRGELAYDGLLMTDDLSMRALRGSFADRARNSLAAGCDLVLHCNGDMDEMRACAEGMASLTPQARRRAERALNAPEQPNASFDANAATSRIAELLGESGDG